jgi:PII-like signaling protein
MKNISEAFILRIFTGSSDRVNNQPLYEFLVFEAKRQGMAGATAIKGVMSYGASSVIHSYKFWEVVDKVPVVVEIVDEESRISDFFETIRPLLESMKYGCLVTMDKTNVLIYKSGIKRTHDI